jgi:iron complex transport system substrate-binding protein
MKNVLVTVLLSVTIFSQPQSSRTFTDGKGHTVSLPAKPMRIASVVLGVDENLMDLVDPSRIVTMTEISKDTYVSNIANRVPAKVTLIKDSFQKVIDAKPDLILAATYTPTLADPLIQRKLPVYQFSDFTSIDAYLKNFEILGQLTGEEKKAQEILAADRAALANAAKKKPVTPKRAVYFSEGFIFGRGTVPSDVLTRAGLIDAAAESGQNRTANATPELIEKLHPDVIFFGEDAKSAEDETRAMFKKPEYQKIAAVKAGRVYAIAAKHITTTSHNIVKAVEDVQALMSQSK